MQSTSSLIHVRPTMPALVPPTLKKLQSVRHVADLVGESAGMTRTQSLRLLKPSQAADRPHAPADAQPN